jgi:hypothetical protein
MTISSPRATRSSKSTSRVLASKAEITPVGPLSRWSVRLVDDLVYESCPFNGDHFAPKGSAGAIARAPGTVYCLIAAADQAAVNRAALPDAVTLLLVGP